MIFQQTKFDYRRVNLGNSSPNIWITIPNGGLHQQNLVNFTRNPPTPALAKAGAAPGTTAGVELLLLSFPRPLASP